MNKILNTIEEPSVCLAIASGKTAAETTITHYVGIAPCFLHEVNPSKEGLEKLLGREWTKELNYLGTNDKGQQKLRLCFPIITDASKTNGVKIITLHNINLTNAPAESQDGTKIQVVDEFGDFTWIEKSKMGQRPVTSTGAPAKCTANYRPAYQGEEQLTKLLVARVNIKDPWQYIDKQWVLPQGDLSESMARLDHIADYFKGDVSEIKNALDCNTNNRFKVLFGLRPYEGNLYQDIFYYRGEGYMKLNLTNFNRLESAVAAYKENHSDHIYSVCDFSEYSPEATDLSTPSSAAAPESAANPFANMNGWGGNPTF